MATEWSQPWGCINTLVTMSRQLRIETRGKCHFSSCKIYPVYASLLLFQTQLHGPRLQTGARKKCLPDHSGQAFEFLSISRYLRDLGFGFHWRKPSRLLATVLFSEIPQWIIPLTAGIAFYVQETFILYVNSKYLHPANHSIILMVTKWKP